MPVELYISLPEPSVPDPCLNYAVWNMSIYVSNIAGNPGREKFSYCTSWRFSMQHSPPNTSLWLDFGVVHVSSYSLNTSRGYDLSQEEAHLGSLSILTSHPTSAGHTFQGCGCEEIFGRRCNRVWCQPWGHKVHGWRVSPICKRRILLVNIVLHIVTPSGTISFLQENATPMPVCSVVLTLSIGQGNPSRQRMQSIYF